LSRDLQQVRFSIDISRGRKLEGHHGRELASKDYIDENSVLIFKLTNILNANSFRPTDSSLEYKLYDSSGHLVEQKTSGMEIQNTVSSSIDANETGIYLNYWESGAPANYTFSFQPINFEKNMIIKVKVPSEITIPDDFECIGLAGTNLRNLTCSIDKLDYHQLVISDAAITIDTIPELIKFEVQHLINPKRGTNLTESFVISTYTQDGYLIDQIDAGLELNFFCMFPC